MKNRLLSSLLSIMTPKRITTQCKFFSFDKTSSLIEELKDKFDFKLNLCKLFYINTLILFNAMKAGFSRCKIHAYYAVSFTYLLSLKKRQWTSWHFINTCFLIGSNHIIFINLRNHLCNIWSAFTILYQVSNCLTWCEKFVTNIMCTT